MRRSWALVALGMLLPALAWGGETPLFAPPAAELDAAAVHGVGVMRARTVAFNVRALPGTDGTSFVPQPGQAILLNLFDDVTLRARLVRAERIPKGMTWVGRLENQPLSDVVLTVYDGILTGSVTSPDASYRITAEGGRTVVQQLDHSQFPEDGCFKEVPGGEPAAETSAFAGPAAAQTDDGSLIEVLVAYTPAARSAAGGTSAMVSLINTAVTETNTGYANSGVVQRLHLAGTVELGYSESDISTDLNRVTNTSDGFMDSVHSLRDSLHADMVVLIGEGYVDDPPPLGACGVAWLMPGNSAAFASNAFSVVDRTCATGYYSFGHEMGHNMGLNHARGDDDPVPTGAYPYSFGYKWTGYRTVMAYAPGTRILRFSNPNVSYLGSPTGVSEAADNAANNVLSLNNTRVTVANWRVAPPSQPAPQVTVTSPNGGEYWLPGSTHSITWTSAHLSPASSLKVSYSDGVTTALIATLSSSQTSFDWTVPATPGSAWKVTVCSGVGGTLETCEASDASDAAFTILTARVQPVWNDWFAVSTLETPYVGDFNGDGKTDIITFTRQNPAAIGDVYVALSEGTKFGASTKWSDWFAVTTDETVVIGDFDGDGKDDIATWLGKTTRQVYVARSLGSGMTGATVWLGSIGFDPSDVPLSGDVNGDGKKDLILFARKQGKVYVALSDGTSFGTPTVWHTFFAVSTYERPRVADVTGDGRADIVTFATDSPTAYGDVYVATSSGTSFVDLNGVPGSSSKWHDWFAVNPTEQVRIGDLNDDGKEDFFTFLPLPWGQCYTVLSQGTSMAANVLWPEQVLFDARDVPFTGDADGDGTADIIVFARGEGKVYVSLAR